MIWNPIEPFNPAQPLDKGVAPTDDATMGRKTIQFCPNSWPLNVGLWKIINHYCFRPQNWGDMILWFIIRNTYLVFFPISGAELWKPLEFPKWKEPAWVYANEVPLDSFRMELVTRSKRLEGWTSSSTHWPLGRGEGLQMKPCKNSWTTRSDEFPGWWTHSDTRRVMHPNSTGQKLLYLGPFWILSYVSLHLAVHRHCNKLKENFRIT